MIEPDDEKRADTVISISAFFIYFLAPAETGNDTNLSNIDLFKIATNDIKTDER